jgi:hypothetical protein
MNRLTTLEGKITHLKTLKEDLEQRTGNALYKRMTTLLGKDFSPSLVLVILSDIWQNATLKQKESWQEKARTFPFRCSPGRLGKHHEKTHASAS